MKQEPVAWMYQDKSTHEVSFQKNMRAFVDHSKTYETPLYTAPRELSDEEIEECIVAWVKGIYGNEYVTPSDSHITQGTRLIKLAEEMRSPRELSDEEIENIWHELYPLDSNNYWEDNRKGLCQLRFARAIMERCGIISGTDK